MFKRFLLFSLCFLCVFAFCSCFASSKKQSVQRVLIIGNSHSVDAFHLLYQAYKDQNPNSEICLGVLYYTGCSITKHVSFAKNNEKVYRFYKNIDGKWEIINHIDMKKIL